MRLSEKGGVDGIKKLPVGIEDFRAFSTDNY
jgi:hypothetical protein